MTEKLPAIAIDLSTVTFPPFATKAAREKWMRGQIETVPGWTVYALMAIYARQTADEQQADTVSHDNSVGFASVDGQILSSFAKQVKQWGKLSVKQFDLCKKRLPKYARQVIDELTVKGIIPAPDKTAAAEAEQATPEATEAVAPPVLPPPALFAEAAPVAPVAVAPEKSDIDWKVWRKVNTAQNLETIAGLFAEYGPYVDGFAGQVWETVKGQGWWSLKQGKVLAVGLAKAAAKCPAATVAA